MTALRTAQLEKVPFLIVFCSRIGTQLTRKRPRGPVIIYQMGAGIFLHTKVSCSALPQNIFAMVDPNECKFTLMTTPPTVCRVHVINMHVIPIDAKPYTVGLMPSQYTEFQSQRNSLFKL